MQIKGQAALVTGGGSGLGEATARELARLGARVAVLDVNLDHAKKVASDIGGLAIQADVTSAEDMQSAIDQAAAAHGPARILMQIAGIGSAKRVVGKDGNAAPLEDFVKVVNVNGGAIALGHPLAATGVRLTITVAREMQRAGVKYGISSACVGGGQGMALLLENPAV